MGRPVCHSSRDINISGDHFASFGFPWGTFSGSAVVENLNITTRITVILTWSHSVILVNMSAKFRQFKK